MTTDTPPIPMLLHCPMCRERHNPQTEKGRECGYYRIVPDQLERAQ